MDEFSENLPEVAIPEIIPAMTLPETVLFPNALMPLYIFEERYRQMLKDSIDSNRLFAVIQKDPSQDPSEDGFHKIGTVGVIRASHANEDGTSHVVLQGLIRFKLLGVLYDKPYPRLKIEPINSKDTLDLDGLKTQRLKIDELIQGCQRIVKATPKEMMQFLDDIDEHNVYLDVTIQTLCPSSIMKQRLLETLDIAERFKLFENYLKGIQREENLFRKLQGSIRDDEIDLN